MATKIKIRQIIARTLAIAAAINLVALSTKAQPAEASLPAQPSVASANKALLNHLPFRDRQDFEDANRGFIATIPDSSKPDLYTFLNDAAPPTVNPSLWRQAQLNSISGLFQVSDGVYQVRGFSLANMTIVEGVTGLIVIDPLMTVGSARAALDLYYTHRRRRPIIAVVYTHTHGDHYAGVKGITTEADVRSGKTKIIAPAGFLRAAVSEYVMAGNPMARRAQYQFGTTLPRNDRGNVDAGLGKWESRSSSTAALTGLALEERTIIAPTDSIEQPVEKRTIDGVTMEFQLAPASEAPAEMHIYPPESRVLNMAENATHALHNLLPLRGTEVRDANAWSYYISEALEQFGVQAQVLIAQHHWPVWGNRRVTERLRRQRDLYKYIHDQTVRMMNQGYTPAEIAEDLKPPPGLENDWSTREYYGTLSHNAKAVYQKYLGWYDGNPAHLNPLPPVKAARKYVEYMGGTKAVLARAREDFKTGNYRWVAEVMNQVVYAEPANRDARSLAAAAFEQLGYAAESATWRNAYLMAAQELRSGPPPPRRSTGASPEMVRAMSLANIFDHLGTRLNASRAGTTQTTISWRFTDTSESAVSTLSHAALTVAIAKAIAGVDAEVSITRSAFEAVVLGRRTFADVIKFGDGTVKGDATRVTHLFTLFDDFDAAFPLVEPRNEETRRQPPL